MSSTTRRVRPLDYVLAAGTTALGVLLMRENMHGSTAGVRIDSTSWTLIPVFAAVTLPILWRRLNLWAVLAVTAAALAVHVVAFGWVTRCGAGLPLTFALSYAAGRLLRDRRQSVAAFIATVGIQYLVLVRDSSAGLGILPFTAVIAAAFWGAGLFVTSRLAKRSQHRDIAASMDAPAARTAEPTLV